MDIEFKNIFELKIESVSLIVYLDKTNVLKK